MRKNNLNISQFFFLYNFSKIYININISLKHDKNLIISPITFIFLKRSGFGIIIS